jgi:hypothetical protein
LTPIRAKKQMLPLRLQSVSQKRLFAKPTLLEIQYPKVRVCVANLSSEPWQRACMDWAVTFWLRKVEMTMSRPEPKQFIERNGHEVSLVTTSPSTGKSLAADFSAIGPTAQ